MMNPFFFCSDKNPCNANDEYCPSPHDKVAHYTQIILNGQCVIPEPKPDCKKLVSNHHSITIEKAETVNSVEFIKGCRVEGKKVIVAGIFKLGFTYSDYHPTQKVHFFECAIPFQAILLTCRNNEEHLFPLNFCLKDFIVHVCVEDLEVKKISERTFNKIIVLMIWLQPKCN